RGTLANSGAKSECCSAGRGADRSALPHVEDPAQRGELAPDLGDALIGLLERTRDLEPRPVEARGARDDELGDARAGGGVAECAGELAEQGGRVVVAHAGEELVEVGLDVGDAEVAGLAVAEDADDDVAGVAEVEVAGEDDVESARGEIGIEEAGQAVEQ